MNTDNMSMLGLTIDYGPYGLLEPYDPDWTPNTTDAAGRRYRYGNQPQVALWNLVRLANALLPLVGGDPSRSSARSPSTTSTLDAGHARMLAQKLGLRSFRGEPHLHGDALLPADHELVNELFSALRPGRDGHDALLSQARGRASTRAKASATTNGSLRCWPPTTRRSARPRRARRMCRWLHRYAARVRADGTADAERTSRMNAVNPKYVLRNYLAQLAIDRAEAGDASLTNELLEVLAPPLRRAARQGALRREAPRLGAQSRRLLHAVVQLLAWRRSLPLPWERVTRHPVLSPVRRACPLCHHFASGESSASDPPPGEREVKGAGCSRQAHVATVCCRQRFSG